jgi:hypothetical protein
MKIVQLIRRSSGLLEAICEHGIGHPVKPYKKGFEIHGCDRCCKDLCQTDVDNFLKEE